MGFIEILLIGVGLSMDAFAVAVCRGLKMKKLSIPQALVIGAFFGGFQALMPFLGWLLGTQFERFITRIDHWIAFGLLALIGANMIREAVKGEAPEAAVKDNAPLNIPELFMLAVATSIDALAVGVSFAFLDVKILPAVIAIGLTTFVISVTGVAVGNIFGSRYEHKAEFAGGVILILLGLKILLEDTILK